MKGEIFSKYLAKMIAMGTKPKKTKAEVKSLVSSLGLNKFVEHDTG